MKIYTRKIGSVVLNLRVIIFYLIYSTSVYAQGDLPLQHLYADTVVINGRVYTMDDAGLNPSMETVMTTVYHVGECLTKKTKQQSTT